MSIKNITAEIVLKGRMKNQCWFSPLMAAVPSSRSDACPTVYVHVTQQVGNDLGPTHILTTSDCGKRWSLPAESLALEQIPLENDTFESPTLAPVYHKKTGNLISFGNTVFSRDKMLDAGIKCEALAYDKLPERRNIFAVWNEGTGDWNNWKEMLVAGHIAENGIVDILVQPCNQTVELEDGTILLPAVVKHKDMEFNRATTLICKFDGQNFMINDIGGLVGIDKPGGLHEPSMIGFGGRFLMTIRSDCEDFRMYFSQSNDGINWDGISAWCWDDGSEIETENTQQHWLSWNDELYLVYTRVNDMSNGVFRSRAPLFIARVDTQKYQLIRSSEKVVIPAKDARMGNFAVADITKNEAWVMAGEWIEQYNPDWKEGMRFYCNIESNGKKYNRNQYIGDLLLARISFG